MQRNVPQSNLQNDSDFRRMIKEKLKEDPTTLAFLLEELSKYGVDVDKESARDFIRFNLKVKLIEEIVGGYIVSFLFTLVGGGMLLMSVASLLSDKIDFLRPFYIDFFAERPGFLFGPFFFLVFASVFLVGGILEFIKTRKLHKALKASKKT